MIYFSFSNVQWQIYHAYSGWNKKNNYTKPYPDAPLPNVSCWRIWWMNSFLNVLKFGQWRTCTWWNLFQKHVVRTDIISFLLWICCCQSGITLIFIFFYIWQTNLWVKSKNFKWLRFHVLKFSRRILFVFFLLFFIFFNETLLNSWLPHRLILINKYMYRWLCYHLEIY